MKKYLLLNLLFIFAIMIPMKGQNLSDTVCKANFSYTIDHSIMSILPSLAVRFQNESFPDSAKYLWDFGDGNTSSEKNPFHIYNLLPKDPTQNSLISEFKACLTIYSPVGCQSSICLPVHDIKDTVVTPCSVSFSYFKNDSVPSIPELIPYVFNGQSNAKVIKWKWDFGDGQTSTEQNPKHAFNFMDTSSYVCLTIETAEGCTNSYCQMIYLRSNPCQADFSYTISKSLPPIFNFTDNSQGNPDKYYWDFGDGTSSYEKNPNHVFNGYPAYITDSLGTTLSVYKVCHTISSISGCYSTTCQEITVAGHDTIPPSGCNYHILINMSQVLGANSCQGSASAVLTDDMGNKFPGVGYKWSNGSYSSSTSGLCSNFPYYVIITDEKGCETAASFALMDYNSPVPYIGLWQYRKSGTEYQFGSTTNNNNLQYVWEFDNGDSLVGNSVNYNANEGSTQKVVLKVKDSNGNVLYTENIYLNQLDVASSTDKLAESEGNIHYYPNPVNHTLYIDISGLDANTKIIADLYDTSGQLLLSKQYAASENLSNIKLDVSGLTKGLFIIKLRSESKTIGTVRFVK